MAVTGELRCQGTIAGGLTGPKEVDLAWTISAGATFIERFSLVADTPTTLTLPTSGTLVILVPPVGNTTPWGITTDSGAHIQPFHLTLPVILTKPTGTTSIVLQSTGSALTDAELWCV